MSNNQNGQSSFYRGKNQLLNKFDNYERNNRIPFKNNDLIDKNPNVSSQINEATRSRMRTTSRRSADDVPIQRIRGGRDEKQIIGFQDLSKLNNPNMKREDIIMELLKPIKIDNKYDNPEVRDNFNKLKDEYKLNKAKNTLVKEFKITNEPYKNIMKEHQITKPVDEITAKDMIVFDARDEKTIKESKNIGRFMAELSQKRKEAKKINAYLEMEYRDDHHDTHMEKYKYKESYVTRMKNDEGKTFDETKQDYIEFYQEKQRVAEEGLKEIDSTIRSLVDSGIIRKEDIPT